MYCTVQDMQSVSTHAGRSQYKKNLSPSRLEGPNCAHRAMTARDYVRSRAMQRRFSSKLMPYYFAPYEPGNLKETSGLNCQSEAVRIPVAT